MFIATAAERDQAPEGRNVDIALLTELASLSASVTINMALLTELADQLLSAYSYLRATIGSVRAARRAGTKLATRATPARKTATTAKVTRSVALTPNNRLDR